MILFLFLDVAAYSMKSHFQMYLFSEKKEIMTVFCNTEDDKKKWIESFQVVCKGEEDESQNTSKLTGPWIGNKKIKETVPMKKPKTRRRGGLITQGQKVK